MSISTAQSGIKAAQVGFGASVENIVSGQNIGGKAVMTDFSSIVTTSPGGTFSPGAISTTTYRNVAEQGIIKTTGIGTHLAIAGVNGFAVVKNSYEANTGMIGMKRGGAFNRNLLGYLEDKGQYLMGWPVDTDGTIPVTVNTEVADSLIPIQVNQIAGVVRKTTKIEFRGNMSCGTDTAPGDSFTKTQRIYDVKGTPHNVIFQYKRLSDSTTDSNNQVKYAMTATVEGGSIDLVNADSSVVGTISPDTAFQAIMDDKTNKDVANHATAYIVTFDQSGNVNAFFDPGTYADGAGAGAFTTKPKNIHISWPGTVNETLDIQLDFGEGKGAYGTGSSLAYTNANAEGKLTSFDGASLITFSDQNGLGYGRFENIRIDSDGLVNALFSNGRSVPIAKIAMASVPSPNDLDFASGNVFYETRTSGTMVLGQAGQNGLGDLKSGSLEGSTVALDDEFGKIMELKLYYQGCLMTMKQADNMASELISVMK